MLATIDMQWSVREMPLEGGMGFACPPHPEGCERATGPGLKHTKRLGTQEGSAKSTNECLGILTSF